MAITALKKNAAGYNYKYTDLAEIHSYLEERGWSYYQYTEVLDGNDYIVTVPIIDGKEQPGRRGCRVTQATLKGVNNPAQEQGSAITYARRYSVLMAFGLCTTDDDAACMSTLKEEEALRSKAITKDQITKLKAAAEAKGVEIKDICDYFKVKTLEGLTAADYGKSLNMLNRK